MQKLACAIVGSGNIGTDLMIKLVRYSETLACRALVGIDPASDGLARARGIGVHACDAGLEAFLTSDEAQDVRIVFDATSAGAHHQHAELLRARGITAIDMTPAALGPAVVPVVNLDAHLDAPNVNMITCGGQATIPIVHAIARTARVPWAEMVSSIASRSAGPGTRANIDEFTETTGRGLESIGGAERGKAIIILNPAEPPLIMRNTVFALVDDGDERTITDSIHAMVDDVRTYVPGYRLKADPVFDSLAHAPVEIPGIGRCTGLKVTVLLEVEGAAHYLPAYAGNLDIMTAAARRVGERIAARMQQTEAAA